MLEFTRFADAPCDGDSSIFVEIGSGIHLRYDSLPTDEDSGSHLRTILLDSLSSTYELPPHDVYVYNVDPGAFGSYVSRSVGWMKTSLSIVATLLFETILTYKRVSADFQLMSFQNYRTFHTSHILAPAKIYQFGDLMIQGFSINIVDSNMFSKKRQIHSNFREILKNHEMYYKF